MPSAFQEDGRFKYFVYGVYLTDFQEYHTGVYWNLELEIYQGPILPTSVDLNPNMDK